MLGVSSHDRIPFKSKYWEYLKANYHLLVYSLTRYWFAVLCGIPAIQTSVHAHSGVIRAIDSIYLALNSICLFSLKARRLET